MKDKLRKDKALAFEFLQKINFILAKTRETNSGIMDTKPNPDPSKVAVSRVEFPEEGGVFTYYEGHKYPAKGFCYGETVETVDEVKKTGMTFLRSFFNGLEQNKIKMILFVLLFSKQFVILFVDLLGELDYRMWRVRQKPERYCRCAREIYRVFTLMMKWYSRWSDTLEHFRNIICMVLEYDDAYRYPFQDVIPEFNSQLGRKNIIKEIKRLLDLAIERDHRGVAERFGRIKKLLFLLNIDKNLKEAIKRFFLELNLDEIKMDEADKSHAILKEDYDWRVKKEETKAMPSPSLIEEYAKENS